MNTQPNALVLVVGPDASIVSLHDETLRLDELGQQEVRRASHVEFDPSIGSAGEWCVEDAVTGERLYHHPLRSACLSWEKDHFNGRLRSGFRPTF